jgi:hypothetical protein
VERTSVLNGTESDDEGVVHLYNFSEVVGAYHSCTGILVAENLVVTAQHCVSNFRDGRFTCTSQGELQTTSNAGEMGTLLEPSAIEIRIGVDIDLRASPAAVGAEIFASPSATICSNDIALLRLDRRIEGMPLSPIRLGRSVEPGDELRVVGYGQDEAGVLNVRHTRSNVPIAGVGDNTFRPNGEAIAPRAFYTAGPLLCPGDSGGPAVAESGALVGVFSLVVGECTSTRARNVFTQVSPFEADVIGPAFEAAGTTPILEPGSGSAGAGGASAGGAAGEGGADSGGEAGESSGGSGGAGTPGTAGTGGDATSAGDAGAPAYRGLRQKGGCRCDVAGAPTEEGGLALPFVAACAALLRRRRRA